MKLKKSLSNIRLGFTACLVSLVVGSSTASAQLDRIYPPKGSATTGSVTDIRRDGVVAKVGSSTQNIRLDKIRKITFEGDPSPLTRGRDLAVDGQYQSALDELTKVDLDSIRRDAIAADAMFYRAASEARLALSGQGDRDAAIRSLRAFAQRFPQSWHFYEAAELLGDLAVASGNHEAAAKFYASLGNSSVSSVKLKGVYLLAIADLRQGNYQEAIAGLDKVIDADTEASTTERLKRLARAQRALARAEDGDGREALAEADEMIAEMDPEDGELAARIYNARGAAHRALGDDEAALLDYLHTHLLFSSVADAHADALLQLVRLWPKIGKPERATEARQELQTRYPGWGG